MFRAYATLLLATLCSILVGCSPAAPEPQRYLTQDESGALAADYVLRMDEYARYGGNGLTLVNVEPMDCLSCWTFRYEFDTDGRAPEDVIAYSVEVPVTLGQITSVRLDPLTLGQYSVTEMLNATCRMDSDCPVPVGYLVRSNCPYGGKCIDGACAVVCNDWRAHSRITEAAYRYVQNSTMYRTYNGSDLQIIGFAQDGCPTCFEVNMTFTLDSEKAPSVRDNAIAIVSLSRSNVVGAVFAQGDLGLRR